jgi:hypothetical protein
MWTGGDALGNTTVKILYTALVSTKNYNQDLFWKQKNWKWNTQLKIKLFT